MPKSDRILASLPPAYRAQGGKSALRALADAYGGELQTAENSLAAVMRAHWVGFADAGERTITDLRLIGALYGLAPRDDESVEEFRDHLTRYVRTFLEGTVTVRGILRITAEALGLHIEDEGLDTWWTRDDPVLVSTQPRGADAAPVVLGAGPIERLGRDAAPAVLDGEVDLWAGVDLRVRGTLRIAWDGHGVIPVELPRAAAVLPAQIVAAVNDQLGVPGFASEHNGRIRLTSPATGTAAEIALPDGPGDAADLVLGIPPRSYQGTDATRARVTGTADLSAPVDLTAARYLRIAIDGHHLAEIDCATLASNPAAVGIGEITDAINTGLGIAVAANDGRYLSLTSPTPGAAGSIAFLQPAAQPATRTLFGPVPSFTLGADQRPATVVGNQELGLGVDLRSASRLRLSVDAAPAVTLNIVGADPQATTPAEIVSAINEGLPSPVASHNGNLVTLTSPTLGPAGTLVIEEVEQDAAPAVLGLRARRVRGAAPSTASLTGTPDLSGGVDLSARHLLVLSVDGAPPVEADLRRGVADITRATVGELAHAVNASVQDPVATHDGTHLILASATPGAAGRLAVTPLQDTLRRRFLSRATVTDDAATRVFGYPARRVSGAPAVAARIAGGNDLSAGADLTVNRYLRLRVGDAEPVEVDCAGPQARATAPQKITELINDAVGYPVAVTNGHTLTLIAPAEGAHSRLALEPPRTRDALGVVLGFEPAPARGTAPTGVQLTGTADLSAGVDLPADATLRLAVDGAPAMDISVGDGGSRATRTLSQLVIAVNQALVGQIAAHDGTHLLLTSPTRGTGSRLEIAVPTSGTDATAEILGITAPRVYQGQAATSAAITGTADLTAPVDLTTSNLLRIAVDGRQPVTVDLGARAAQRSAVTGPEIVTAITSATAAAASAVSIPGGLGIQIASPATGPASRIEITRTGAGDAAPLLFGGTGITATGTAPAPAVLDGVADLLAPVNLAERSVIRLALDGAAPVDIDVAGGTPPATLLGEIVVAINEALPGVAQASPQDRLRLTSPTEGPASSVEVVALRFLEVQEYPPAPDSVHVPVAHATVIQLRNTGAAEVPGRVELTTDVGVAGPRFADVTAGWSIRVSEPIGAGGTLSLDANGDGGITATIVERGTARSVPAERLEIEPAGGAGVLVVPRGPHDWSYTECRAARFGAAVFDADRFAGGPCTEEAVFDLSRLGPEPPGAQAVFASTGPRPASAQVRVSWDSHTTGSFVVNLPAELDRRFGIAFGDGRFGAAAPESHAGVVTEPAGDANHIETRINQASALLEATTVDRVPIGWSPVALPFRDPAPLTLGRRDAEAQLYLSDPGLAPRFLELRAAEPGDWGNNITVTGRASGPASYDIEVAYAGGRFEVARQTVLGPALPTLASELLQPGPVGVGTAKAAGIQAAVTRDRITDPAQSRRKHHE